MKNVILSVVVLFAGMASAQDAPSAEQIIGGAKLVAALQQADLEGNMSSGREKVPVALFIGRTMPGRNSICA
jgi:hypothetical protein